MLDVMKRVQASLEAHIELLRAVEDWLNGPLTEDFVTRLKAAIKASREAIEAAE